MGLQGLPANISDCLEFVGLFWVDASSRFRFPSPLRRRQRTVAQRYCKIEVHFQGRPGWAREAADRRALDGRPDVTSSVGFGGWLSSTKLCASPGSGATGLRLRSLHTGQAAPDILWDSLQVGRPKADRRSRGIELQDRFKQADGSQRGEKRRYDPRMSLCLKRCLRGCAATERVAAECFQDTMHLRTLMSVARITPPRVLIVAGDARARALLRSLALA